MLRRALFAAWIWSVISVAGWAADVGNRLTSLNSPADPYAVHLAAPKLVTPQWVGEDGVEAVIVLSVDDMSAEVTAKYEEFLRPILNRLKQIDGRAPLSIMTKTIEPQSPQLRAWLDEGLSIEAHTYTHPCPCLQGGQLEKAKDTYDRCVDLLATQPQGRTVGFRMPCCDSMNSPSPRFYTEIFGKTTANGRFLTLDSSVFVLFTANDPSIPRELAYDQDGREKFRKYIPVDRRMVNYVEDYPYPYVIDRLCWQIPSLMPSDWEGQHRNGKCSPNTLQDWKTAVDITVLKQGAAATCFHPHGWSSSAQWVELIDYAVTRYGKRVKFLNFREVQDRLDKHLLAGQTLRDAKGRDRGVRLCDVNHDGYLDVVIGNTACRQTRVWVPQTRTWQTCEFPVELVREGPAGTLVETGVQFGVLQPNGQASILVRNEQASGLWHFTGQTWSQVADGLRGLELNGPVATAAAGGDRGVRLRDLDLDGICELIVGNPQQQAVFAYRNSSWQRLPFSLPAGTLIVDAQGRDAGLRFVDFDEDGHADVVFSNAERYSAHVFTSLQQGWSRTTLASPRRGEKQDLPPFVRADGTNNGAWFKNRHLWVQNEDTGGKLPQEVDARSFTHDLLGAEKEPPPRAPVESRSSLKPRSGFQVELMASEPLVMDPIDLAWGPDGKLWVVEMADYPLGLDNRGKPGGRIRYLEDTDGDGVYDKATVFLEPVPFPTGVMPWRKGVLITAAPTVFYAEDTDGDGRADLRKTLFNGFHEGNQQHRVNHPRWGLDNWVHVANGDSDGLIRSLQTGQVADISGRDLRFRPDEGLLDPQTGRTQFGRNRDDWGTWFGCNNNDPGWSYVLDDHYIRRNPHVASPSGLLDLTQHRDVYPLGRVMTHCFIDQPTPPEGTPGRWTSVAGAMVYRDELFGPHFAGNYFVEDSVYNSIHRLQLTYDGIRIRGQRAPDEDLSEFLSSVDPWFRPTTMQTGPDGALWVADMYRHVIEHPQWIDERLQKTLDFRRGHELGRLYRIYPVGQKPRPIPRLDRLDTAGLVAALDHPNGWQRDMAQQLLVWRGDKGAAPQLERLLRESPRPLARLHALCTLDGLQALTPANVLQGLSDAHPGVRRHAVRLGEQLVNTHAEVGVGWLRLLDDSDGFVQLQLAYSLGEWTSPQAGPALGRLAMRHAEDPYLLAAVLSSAVPHVAPMLAEVRAQHGPEALIEQLVKLADDIKQHPVQEASLETTQRLLLAGPGQSQINGQTTAERQAALDRFTPVLNMAGDAIRGKKVFVEATCSICHRLEDVGEEIGPDIKTLIDRSPQNLLVAIIDPNRAVKERFVEYFVRTENGHVYSGMLLEQTGNSVTLADNKGHKIVLLRRDLEEIVPTTRSHMGEGLESSLSLQNMADLLAFLGQAGPPRKRFAGNQPTMVLAAQDGALSLTAANAEIYGPELTFDADRAQLTQWTSAGAYAVWSFHLQSRQQCDVWLELACPEKEAGRKFLVELVAHTLPNQVAATAGWDDFRWQKVASLNFEAGAHRIGVRSDGPLAGPLFRVRGLKLTRPGQAPEFAGATESQPTLVKPTADGSLRLRAAVGRGIGPQIRFEAQFQNFGFFSGADRVEWEVEVAKAGEYEARLEWAVDDANAGKSWGFSLGDQRLEGVVGRTGNWETYEQVKMGRLKLAAGKHQAVFRPVQVTEGYLMDLREIRVVPVAGK